MNSVNLRMTHFLIVLKSTSCEGLLSEKERLEALISDPEKAPGTDGVCWESFIKLFGTNLHLV